MIRQPRTDLRTVITQVFPDDFHLNTLDQLLPAIARLNPHVNIKAIVIGLMDRLSKYASTESGAVPQEERVKSEEDAVATLLEKIRISKEQDDAQKQPKKDGEQANGEPAEAKDGEAQKPKEAEKPAEEPPSPAVNGVADEDKKQSGKHRVIPANIRLFEIFYGQVTHLVQAQRLPIQDTIALLVSLANLAL